MLFSLRNNDTIGKSEDESEKGEKNERKKFTKIEVMKMEIKETKVKKHLNGLHRSELS